MDGQLNSENLKTLQSETVLAIGERGEKPTMSSQPKMNFRERLAASRSELDKKSDAGSSGSRTLTKKTFSRLKAKLKIHNLFGGGASKSGSEFGAKPVRTLENSYRTEPTEGTGFSTVQAEEVMRKVFEGYLGEKKYDPKRFPLLSKSLADMIKERVKLSGLKRHKIVATVIIAEDAGQTVRIGSRCLWNDQFDSYATYTFEGNGFAAIGSVYALYYE